MSNTQWIIKREDGKYWSHYKNGSTKWSDKQRDAIRCESNSSHLPPEKRFVRLVPKRKTAACNCADRFAKMAEDVARSWENGREGLVRSKEDALVSAHTLRRFAGLIRAEAKR
jgi:hypothetical protein